MSIEIYVFDCDGVIINSGEDIAAAVNASLKNSGFWQVPAEKIVEFTGDGAKNLILRALNFSTKGKLDLSSDYGRSSVQKVLDFYLKYYYSHPVEKTYLYAGIPEFLRKLKEKEKFVCLLTNKPEDIAKVILKKFEIFQYFDLITGPETEDENGNKIKMKPAPDGLFFTLKKINEKFQTAFTNQNVIMFGDSAQDIQAGKAFGGKTVACRGGLGNKERLLAENPTFSFSVASEAEKFIDILSKDSGVSEMEKYAVKNEIPALQDEGSDFICDYIKNHNVKNILEIGTAIATSSIRFAKLDKKNHVTTVEIDTERFSQAQKNVQDESLSERITLIFGDALSDEVFEKIKKTAENGFDLIFIDAAKAQYINFFNKYSSLLSQNGVVITDNLSFHGMVEDLSLTHNYSTKKLVKKIRKYIEFLKSNTEFETEFYKVGDGISVSKRKI